MASNNTKTPNKTNNSANKNAAANNINKLLENIPKNNNVVSGNAPKNNGGNNNNKTLKEFMNQLDVKPANNNAKLASNSGKSTSTAQQKSSNSNSNTNTNSTTQQKSSNSNTNSTAQQKSSNTNTNTNKSSSFSFSLPSVDSIMDGESPLWTVIKVSVALLVLFGLLYLGKYLYTQYSVNTANAPLLLDGNKNAKHALVVSQDPNNPSYIPIKRSEEQNGIQFTYSFWFYIENLDYKNGEWKHVFHKGNSSSYPNRAPGVWLHPTKNSVRIYMNTQDNILEFVDIDNIPLRKWVHMAVILNNQNLDIYVNGYLKERKALESIPRQNDDDFWINMFGGFEGFVSNIQYFSYAVDFGTINSIIKTGPSKSNCIDTSEVPPYLNDNWWYQP